MVVSSQEATKALSVCEVLSRLSSFNNKELTIRGELVSTEHGKWLRPAHPCEEKLTTEGFTWPNGIHLVEDKFDTLDFPSLAQTALKLKQAANVLEKHDVIISYTGKFYTRVPLVVAHYPDGKVSGYGFGHLDASPGELRYRAVGEVVLRKKVNNQH